MGNKYKFIDPDLKYFISYAVVGWVDVFTRDEYRNILLDSWGHCQKEKGLVIHAWVIMTNHVHMIISKKGENKLEAIMRDMKKYTASKIITAIMCNEKESRREWMLNIFSEAGQANSNNKHHQFWKQDNHPIYVESENVVQQKLAYLHNNPVRSGFVNEPTDWKYSSAIDYYTEQKGMIEIEHI